MNRFLLSVMALCLCAVMSFAAITLPYSEDFEGYGKTVTYTVGTATTATAQGYVNHWTKVKVPTGWTVGNKAYSDVTSESPNNGITTATYRQYVPYVCTNGTGASANPTTGYADKATSYKNATSGYNALRLYPSTTTYAPAWAAMPELDASVNLQKVVITFNAKMAATTNYTIFVGMSPTANYNAETIVKVGEVGPGKGVSTGSTVYDAVAAEIKLKDYAGTGRYIIFYTNPSTAAINAFIDDIYVYEAECDAPVPSIAGITDNTAQIAIDIAEGYYDIKVMEGAVAAKDVEATQGTSYDGLVDRPYTINDLQADKQYTVAARMWCDEMGSTKSVWKTISFKTLCTYATLDVQNVYYKTGFEDAEGFVANSALDKKVLPCWEVGNASPGATYSNMPYVAGVSTYAQGGDTKNHYLYMYATTTYPKAYAVLPAISPENGDWSKVEMSYKMTCSTSASYNHKVKIGIMNNPLDPSTFVEVAEKEINVPTVAKEGWQTVVVTFENMPKSATGNCIAFMMNYENAISYAYIDDVDVHKLSDCAAPNSLQQDSIAADACKIMWNGKAEKQYLVKWALEKVADEEKAAYTNWAGSQVVTGPAATITGLKANTAYYFTIQTICGQEEYSEYSAGMLPVRTECPESYEIPYFNDFNSNSAVGSGKNADCWTGLQYTRTSTSTSYPQVIASKGLTGTGDNAFYLLSACDSIYIDDNSKGTYSRTYAISPKMNVADLSQYMVRFYVTNTSLSNTTYTYRAGIVIGVTSDPDETKIESNFVALDTITYEGVTYQQFAVDMSKYAAKIGAAKYVVLKSDAKVYDLEVVGGRRITNNSYAYIDNFEIVVPPCCVQPSLAVAGNAGHSLTVEIEPYKATDSQWQLAAVAEDAPNDTLYFIANATTYEMTGLQPGTIYKIYARTYCASCGEGEYSEWTKMPVEGRTKDYYVDSYFFGFEPEDPAVMTPGTSPSTSYMLHPALQCGLTKSTSAIPSSMYLPMNYKNAYNVTTGAGTYQYAKDGEGALRFTSNYSVPGTSSAPTTYNFGGYVIFPALDECSADKRSIRFNYRNGYNYAPDYATESDRNKMTNGKAGLEVLFGLVPKGTTTLTEENFTLLETLTPANNNDKVATAENDKFWETMVVNITKQQAMNYQACIWYKQEHTVSESRYFHVDNFQITEAINFEIPTLTSVIPADVSVSVTWDSVADPMNVYVFDGGTKVAEALNVTDNKVTVSGLSASTSYVLKVVDANVPSAMEKVATVTREFTTECEALVVTDENPVLFTFDENISKTYPTSTAAADSVYWSPDCWYITNPGSSIGTTKYYNWLIQRQGYSYMLSPTPSVTYDNYNFGMKDSLGNATNSLRLYGTSSTGYKPAYAALPRVKGNINEYVLDFYFRPASLNGSGKIATISSEKKFYIVAMSDVTDFSTADTIYTVEYPETLTTSLVGADDPKGLEYWREFVVALDKADANDRIAFVQEGLQSCYLYVDNVMIRKPGANEVFIPQNLGVENITKESATLTWESSNIGATYLLTVLEGEEEILQDEPVNGLSYNLAGLSANTKYKFYVKAVKGEYSSDASGAAEFNTSCPTYGLDDFVFSFETDENLIDIPGSTTSMKQNSCWVYENLGSYTSVSSTYWPYNIKSGTTVYSHSGDYALKLYASRNTSNDTLCMTRVISPEIENASQIFAQKVLKIYYRPVTHNATTKAVAQGYNGVTYGRGFIVGTCSNPADESTFVTLDTVYYTKNPTSAEMNEEGDFGWMKAFVKLDQAVGNHIWMKTLLKDTVASVYAYGGMYIDDISFTDPMPILTTAVNDQTMGKVTAGDAYATGDPVTVTATANYNYKFVDWSDGATDNPYTFTMPAQDYTITANFAAKAITISELEGEGFANETTEGDVRWVRVPGASADTYRQIAGWVYSNAGTTKTWSTSFPYNKVGATTATGARYGHSLETDDYSLYLYSIAAGTTIKGYVATPEISDINTLVGKQIEFYMRAGYVSNASTGAYSSTYATSSYARSVEVGTCSNPKDPATFHKLNTVWCKAVVSGVTATEDNDYLWEKQKVAFTSIPTGDKYIYFMANNYLEDGTTQKVCYAYIDDISFADAQPVITVEANDPTMGTVSGSGSYDAGTEVEITATPVYNHHFVQWNDGNTNASRTITVDGNATYTATFALNTFNAADINETFEAEEGGVQRWTFLPGTTTTTYKATVAWTYGNVGTGTSVSSFPYNVVDGTSKYSYQGDYAAKLYASSPTISATYCGYIVTPKIEDYDEAFDAAQFSFYMKPTYYTYSTKKETVTNIGTNYAKSVIVGVATDPTDLSTFTPVDTITYNVPGLSGTTLANASADNNYNWQKVTVDLKNNKAPYVYIMASRVDATGKTYTYDNMYIDNISFIAPVTVAVETEDALKGSAVVVGDATVEAGQNVTIKAVPEDTYVFAAWKQGETVVSNDAEYTFALTKNETYTATFKKDTLTIQVTTEGNGTVNINGAGTEAKVEKYTSLTLNAVADQGYQFVQWSDGNQDNPRQVSATEDKIYTAEFAAASVKVLVYVDAESAGMGAVAATGEGPAVNMYYVGKTVTMTATANEGYVFVKWNDGNTDNPRQITASAEVTYYASFKRDKAVVRQGLHSGNYYTLCEPQKLTEIEGAIFFQPESWDGSRLVLAEVEEVKAGYGYMFQATSDKVLAVLTGDAVAAPVDAQVAKNGMQGTAFSGITNLPEGNDYCGIMNNHLQYFGANNTMIAKRAYVIFSAISGQKAPARARRISMTTSGSNVATMLDNVRFDDDEAAAKFIIDGQLIIMKGGKMYNAQGQEL